MRIVMLALANRQKAAWGGPTRAHRPQNQYAYRYVGGLQWVGLEVVFASILFDAIFGHSCWDNICIKQRLAGGITISRNIY